MELNDLQLQRADKLARLRAAGIEGYPARAQRTHIISAVLADFDGMMERGEVPSDRALVGGLVRDVCFANARAHFRLALDPAYAG